MPAIAIVGAGTGLGASIAKVFGAHDYRVALISRNKENLNVLVAQLAEAGITAAGFPADVTDRPALTAALRDALSHFGSIDVLEYSPYGGLTQDVPADVTVDGLQQQMEHHLYGAVTAVNAVLPAMLQAGTGTLLLTTGGGAINPYPMLASVNAAQAAQRNWTINLHNVLAAQGVYAANVAINVFIGTEPPAPGYPYASPDDIARVYWELHNQRTQAEHLVTG
jgi:NADP-dependent 3-hydroxy acid dehydrogenase YdfG